MDREHGAAARLDRSGVARGDGVAPRDWLQESDADRRSPSRAMTAAHRRRRASTSAPRERGRERAGREDGRVQRRVRRVARHRAERSGRRDGRYPRRHGHGAERRRGRRTRHVHPHRRRVVVHRGASCSALLASPERATVGVPRLEVRGGAVRRVDHVRGGVCVDETIADPASCTGGGWWVRGAGADGGTRGLPSRTPAPTPPRARATRPSQTPRRPTRRCTTRPTLRRPWLMVGAPSRTIVTSYRPAGPWQD